ncbi:MAG: glycosyltransferase family 2 protein [Eubacterium sp.]|nr:glycosyltransferase family 2 protein [Eubacterium sp.]
MNDVCTKPLISVIVTVYNLEKYIEKCIMSICNQTYENLEIIVVDDGSFDKSGDIIKRLEKSDSRIIYVFKENGGISDARNEGIKKAGGKWIAFTDGDDYLDKTMIESLYMSVAENGTLLSVCSRKCVDEFGRVTEINSLPKGVYDEEGFWQLYKKEPGCCVVAWNKLYHKDLWENISYPLGKNYEDEFVIAPLIHRAGKISVTDDVLYNYLCRQGSIMHSAYSAKNLDFAEAMISRSNFFLSCEKYDFARKTLADTVGIFIKAYNNLDFENKDSKDRYNELKSAFKKCYIKNLKKSFNLRFALNTLSFIMSERLYIFTHRRI